LRQLDLEGPDSISVLFTHIVLYGLFKYNNRVVVLLHSALRALDAGLEPFHDALGVEGVLALELLVVALGVLKTHSTSLGKVCTTLAVFDRWVLALGPILRQSGAIHLLLSRNIFLYEFPQRVSRRSKQLPDTEHF